MSTPLDLNIKTRSTKSVTLKNIARALNVSTMTVSLALRNKPPISPARCQQVQKMAQEIGYRPNRAAQSLASRPRSPKDQTPRSCTSRRNTLKTIAWINNWRIPRNLFTNKKYNMYWKGASAAAHHLGVHLQEFVVSHHSSFSEVEKMLRDQKIQSVLVPPHESDCVADWREFNWNGFSAVQIDQSIPHIPGDTITSHEFESSQTALMEMSHRGYSRIGFVNVMEEKPSYFEAGVLLFQAGLKSDSQIPILRLSGEGNPEKDLNDLFLWLQEHRPEAVLSKAPEIKRMIHLLGYQIPKDIALAVSHESMDPSLSGVFFNSEEIGWTAVETLLYSSESKKNSSVKKILIEGRWTDGHTLPHKNMESYKITADRL